MQTKQKKRTLFAAMAPLLVSASASAQESITLLFDFAQHRLGEAEVQALESFWSQLPADQLEQLRFRVQGRADPIGSDEANRTLAARRAQSASDWLERRGIVDRAITLSSAIDRDAASECLGTQPRADRIACLAPARKVTITVASRPQQPEPEPQSTPPAVVAQPPETENTRESEPQRRESFQRQGYIALGLYQANGDQSRGDFSSAMAGDGIDTTISDYDVRRPAYHLSLGYRYHPRLAVELGYLHLGDVDFAFDAEAADAGTLSGALAEHLPQSGDGWTLANRFDFPIGQWRASATAGVYFWEEDIALGDPEINPGSRSGTDPLIGVEAAYPLWEQFELGLQYRRVFMDEQKVDLWGGSLTWHF